MTPDELQQAQDFEKWMIEEEKRKENIVISMPDQTDKRRLPMFKPIKKPDFVFKREGQMSLF